MPNSIVFSNPGASIIRWGDGVAAPYLTLSGIAPSTLVGAAVTGTVTNTGSAAGQWSVASSPADVLVSPSSGTLAVNAFASFTLTALAAGSKVITLTSSTPGATIVGSPVSLTVTSIAPPPPPPAPIAPSAAYRINQSRLFSDVPATTSTNGSDASTFYVTARASVASPKSDYLLGVLGPTAAYVEEAARWAWLNSGGDWINTAGTAQATTLPHVTFAADSVTSGSASYTANILPAATAARSRGKWFALILKATGSTRKIASLHHATLPPPSVSVTYSDGSTATLACTACVRLTAGSSYSLIGSDEATCGTVAIEFEMPTKGMTAATLSITCSTHDATPTTINGYLADPPVSTSPVTTGIAASYPADLGITADPSVLFAQRYVDGTALSDYILTSISPNVFLKSDWDAGLWGGTADTTKLPTAHAGTPVAGTNKWIYKQNTASRLSIVNSSYAADNFVPVAPGLGALRVLMPGATAADGGITGYSGSLGSDLWALFPKTISGLLNELFVRFKFRIASRPELLADTRMLRTEAGAAADYAVAGGKFGIGGHHWTTYGGNDNVGGGDKGWSARGKYTEFPLDSPVSAYGVGIHAYDQLGRDFYLGAEGLGASFYPDTWYDIEVRLRLNTWAPSGGGASDGVCEVWIDGRLDSTHTGWKFRDGPLDPAKTADPGLSPFREIGHIGLCLNSYNGGVKPPDHDVPVFYANIVSGTSRIGPMRIDPVLPSWVPAAGELATLTVANGKLANNWRDAVPAHYQTYYSTEVVNAYGGAVKNPHWGTLGATMWFGSGHASGTNDNGVYLAEYGATQITFKCISQGTNWAASGGQNDGPDPIIDSLVAFPWLESTIDSKPLSPHIWKTSFIQGPSEGGGTYGTFWQALMPAVGHKGFNAKAAYKLPINSLTADTASWARGSAATAGGASSSFLGTIGGTSAPVCTAYVPTQQRCYIFYNSGGNTANLEWLDLTTGAYVTGTGTTLEMDLSDGGSDSSATTFPVPQRNLVVMCYRKAGVMAIQYLNTSISQPTALTATLSNAALPLQAQWSCATWCPDNSRIIAAGVTGNSDAMYEIEIPATLTDPWTVTRAALGSGQTFTPIDVAAGQASSFGKFEYDAKVKCIVYLGKAERSSPDTVYAYRPRNT